MILLLACVAGAPGERGAEGPGGPPGARGERGAVGPAAPVPYVWEDARGRSATVSDRLEQMDNGYLWRVDPEAARLVGVPVEAVFEEDDCEGDAYLVAERGMVAPPRVVMETQDGRFWVRDGDGALERESILVRTGEYRSESGILHCGSEYIGARQDVVRLDGLVQVFPTFMGWAAPLHPAAVERD